MDLVTQGLLGSSLALSSARRHELGKAALIGLIAGLSADVDFLVRSDADPLLNLEFHRHFTHSLLFIPVAALLLSALLWPLFRSALAWRRIFLFCLLGYACSGLLDACTSYGTSLLWPLSDKRFSFNIVSIIDPVFTLLLLVGLIAGYRQAKPALTRTFLGLAACYLVLGFWQKQGVQQISLAYAEGQGHRVERLLVKPTLGNLWLWRSVYQFRDRYHINAIRLNPLTGDVHVYPGASIQRFNPYNHRLAIAADSVLQRDIERFAEFSDDYLALHPDDSAFLFDVRYANLPNSHLPLWGIRLDTDRSEQHARYETYRDSSRETRRAFIDMLLKRGQAGL